MSRAELEQTRRFLSLIARPGDVFELRALVKHHGQPHVTAGYFDDVEELARAAAAESGRHDGVYLTINPVLPALLARAPKNRVRRVGSGDTTSDRDVLRRRNILIDVDPVRPAGISSDDAEHSAALALARRIRDDLLVIGWPKPILADSGNGGHLIYSVDLPVDDGKLVKRVLEELDRRYTIPPDADGRGGIKVDKNVFNPARISKVYGTLTRKGEDIPERPHRLARILEAPSEQLVELTREQLEAFAPVAPAYAQRASTQANHTHAPRPEFDLDAWIATHLPDAIAQSWSEGRKWLLPVCPFNDQHDRREAFITQKHGGSIAAGCQHESCFKTWAELRRRFEPDAYQHKTGNGHANGNGHRLTHREPPPEVLYQDERYQTEIDAFADRDREETPATDPWMPPLVDPPQGSRPADAMPAKRPWYRCPELVAAIMDRANDPWVDLTLGLDHLGRVRAGGTVVLIGGSGSGKSSLASCLVLEHAKSYGPAIALSIELPAEELAARIVGIECDSSWEQALRGQVERCEMERALNIERLFVLDRRRATLKNLERVIDAARAEYPGQPILVAVDYAQLLESEEREARMKVADAFFQIDDVAREKRVVMLALSQMSRVSAKVARRGDALGAEAADLGAETAAIERFATLTLTIGLKTKREDGTTAVELSVGKWRMGEGDRVFPMLYDGRSGKWRLEGVAKSADEVRERRDIERAKKERTAIESQILWTASQSSKPLSANELAEPITGKTKTIKQTIKDLIASGQLVEVGIQVPRAKRGTWKIWTADRAQAAGTPLVRDSQLMGLG